MNEQLKDIQKSLKNELDKERYEHTLGVMYTAGCLAMRYGADIQKAMLAGLLHDCAKCIPNEKKLKLCKKNHIELTPSELANPSLIHAKLGAFLAREQYHITDSEVCHAILVHTTGAPAMNLLDKIVFMADYIEPGRYKADNLAEIRRLAFENLEQAVLQTLEDTLSYLNTRNENGSIDETTIETYNYYKNKQQEVLQ